MSFLESALQYKEFLQNISPEDLPTRDKDKKVGILISPWVGTAVPWFSLTIMFLLMKEKYSPFIIWDDMPFEKETRKVSEENQIIEVVLKQIAQRFKINIKKLSSYNPETELTKGDKEIIEKSSLMNGQWIRTSSVPCQELDDIIQFCRTQLYESGPRIIDFLNRNEPCLLIVPGGAYRTSNLFLRMGAARGFKVSTYDSCTVSLSIGHNTVGACMFDVPVAYKDVMALPQEVRAKTIKYAKTEFIKRLKGADKYNYQLSEVKTEEQLPTYDILIPLNIDTDATALGLSRFFKTSWEWIVETIDFILNNTSATVAVREHPHETRKAIIQGAYIKKLRQIFSSDRLTFFPSNADINSYDLLKNADLILPYVSSMGIEAAMLGKKVLLESAVYYATLPFANQASSKEDYFQKIKAAVETDALSPTSESMESAWITYYLASVCGRIWTGFTPQPQNFERWPHIPFNDLSIQEEVKDIVKAFSWRSTVTQIQHEKLLKKL